MVKEMKNDTEQKGFVVYGDYKAVIDELDDEQAGKLFRGMLNYFVDGEDPNFTDVLKFVFIPIKQQMDRDGCKYQKKCERNRANINKRWGKNDTTVYDGIRPYTNDTNKDTNTNTNGNIIKQKDTNNSQNSNVLKENIIFVDNIKSILNDSEPHFKRLSALHAAAERVEVVVHESAVNTFASRHDPDVCLPGI